MDFTQDEIVRLSTIKRQRAALQKEWDKLAEGIGANVVHPDPIHALRISNIVEADALLAEQRQEIINTCRARMYPQVQNG